MHADWLLDPPFILSIIDHFTWGNLAAFINGVNPARSRVFGWAPKANNNSMHCRSTGETRLISDPKKYLLFGFAPASSRILATSTCRFLKASRSGSSHNVVLRRLTQNDSRVYNDFSLMFQYCSVREKIYVYSIHKYIKQKYRFWWTSKALSRFWIILLMHRCSILIARYLKKDIFLKKWHVHF